MQLPGSIFKAYDIRGIVGKTLTADTVRAIAHSFGSVALDHGQTTVCLGYDGRLSSPMLAAAVTQGLQQAGVDVIDLGMVTTPMLYFACHHLAESQTGIMLTGSHNPPDYNGLKLVLNGQALSGDAIQDLHTRWQQQQLHHGAGSYKQHNIQPAYQAAICEDIHLTRPLHVILDAGNGVAGAYAPALFKALGCKVTPLYCDVDGRFPHHHPDPVEAKNLQDLIQALKHSDADIGLAFDGDGDRLGVVTRDGDIIRSDRQLLLFADAVLKAQPGASIVYDVKSTRHLRNWVSQRGGQPVLWKTGHSLMKAKISEIGAALGGELSGHLFFNDQRDGRQRWPGFDDGLYSGARLLELLSQYADSNAPLNALPDSLNTPELHIALAEGEPHAMIAALQRSARFDDATAVVNIDGLRVEYTDGFGLIRASNTTPVLVLRFEADHPAALARIQQQFRAQILALNPSLSLPV